MRPLVLMSVVAAAVAGPLWAGPALAFQCPKLIAAINSEAGKRLDEASYTARMKAAQAQRLHEEGKHADSEKLAKEGLELLGVKM